MSGYQDQVTRALERIASDKTRESIQDSYNDPGSVMKEMGAPSNNMLLSVIHGECKRSADAISKLNARVERIENILIKQQSGIDKLCELMEIQNTLLASRDSQISDARLSIEPSYSRKQTPGGDGTSWHYQGSKLVNRSKICTCIIAQLIEVVRLRMENKGVFYQDSVDANFTTLDYCVRESAKLRCKIPSVKFKNPIDIPDTSKAASGYDIILPLIASKDPSSSTTLPETRLVELTMPMTRSIMEAVARISERLCYFEGILSPQQIDMLKSIKFPIIVPGTDGDFNWDPSVIKPRLSHPMSNVINDLGPMGKVKYIQCMTEGQSMMQACVTAQEVGKK
jgi:flagellar biosynthesis chaperone FliJ